MPLPASVIAPLADRDGLALEKLHFGKLSILPLNFWGTHARPGLLSTTARNRWERDRRDRNDCRAETRNSSGRSRQAQAPGKGAGRSPQEHVSGIGPRFGRAADAARRRPGKDLQGIMRSRDLEQLSTELGSKPRQTGVTGHEYTSSASDSPVQSSQLTLLYPF